MEFEGTGYGVTCVEASVDPAWDALVEATGGDLAQTTLWAASRQRLSKALDNAVATRYPPPPPEPPTVIVEQDDGSADFGSRNFDVAKWAKKPRSWW